MNLEWLLLVAAGFAGGVINSVAGGGSFITFPALLVAGVPPVSANASNTFASCAGYLSGTYAFRHDLRRHSAELSGFVLLSLAGGIAGAWLLLNLPAALFREAIPWLLLFATVLFITGGWLNALFKRLAGPGRRVSWRTQLLLMVLLFAVAAYGGFFNAGLGIVILSYLALAGYTDINAMNGLKLLVSSVVSLVAIVIFALGGVIAWTEGSLVLLGSLFGGYFAAKTSRLLPQNLVRGFVIVASSGITVYFFLNG